MGCLLLRCGFIFALVIADLQFVDAACCGFGGRINILEARASILEQEMRTQDGILKYQGRRLDDLSRRLVKCEALSKFRFIDLVVEGVGYDDVVSRRGGGSCTRYCNYVPGIKKNGRRVHRVSRRGYTFVVFDGKTGQETSFRQFDIYGNHSLDDEVEEFYNSTLPGSIVVVATYDEPKRGAVKTLNVLKKIGANVSFGPRDGFAMIGCKDSIPSWLVWQHVPRGQGLARVQARVPLMN